VDEAQRLPEVVPNSLDQEWDANGFARNGAGTVGSDLLVFDLSEGRLDEVLNTESRLQYMTDDWDTQTLDLSRTRENHGQRFCFSKMTLFEEGKAFRPPRVTRPCYKRGDGVDSAEVRDRNKMLTPPR
jgi:hypothetical protein